MLSMLYPLEGIIKPALKAAKFDFEKAELELARGEVARLKSGASE